MRHSQGVMKVLLVSRTFETSDFLPIIKSLGGKGDKTFSGGKILNKSSVLTTLYNKIHVPAFLVLLNFVGREGSWEKEKSVMSIHVHPPRGATTTVKTVLLSCSN